MAEPKVMQVTRPLMFVFNASTNQSYHALAKRSEVQGRGGRGRL